MCSSTYCWNEVTISRFQLQKTARRKLFEKSRAVIIIYIGRGGQTPIPLIFKYAQNAPPPIYWYKKNALHTPPSEIILTNCHFLLPVVVLGQFCCSTVSNIMSLFHYVLKSGKLECNMAIDTGYSCRLCLVMKWSFYEWLSSCDVMLNCWKSVS